jgi:hypothetical protein
MKKKPTILSKKLKSYSALAGSLALAGSQADAQIMYTDVTPDSTTTMSGSFYNLDLDNDGTFDFTINLDLNVSSAYTSNFVTITPAGSNAINGSTATPYVYPYAMDAGDTIKPSLTFQTGSAQSMNMFYASASSANAFGNWIGVTDKYLGLQFNIGTQVHYGWARLDVAANGTSFTIKDYAYDATPGASIVAGEMPVPTGIDAALAQNTVIYGYEKTIKVKLMNNSSVEGMITVSDVLGQEIAKVNVTDAETTINMDDAKPGVYFVTISKADGNSYTKKLFMK